MAKKKNKNDKPQVINNIQEVKIEIDYDKLGETIKKSISQDAEEENIDKSEFKKATLKEWITVIGWIITNKAETKGKMTPVLLSMIIKGFFNFLAVLFTILGVLAIVVSIIGIVGLVKTVELLTINTLYFIGLFSIGISLLSFAFVLKISANEFSKEKDRNYIVSVFSGIVSFAALIVALVALFKGVG